MIDKHTPPSTVATVDTLTKKSTKSNQPRRERNIWSWIVFIIGMIYFFLPLFAVFEFSLRAKRGVYSFEAYRLAFEDPNFYLNFGLSLVWSVLTIIIGMLLIIWTAYWVHLRLPNLKPVVEFFTLMPFVVPAVVLVFGMARLYGRWPTDFIISTPIALVAGYVVLSFPYIFRSVDAGLRAIDVRTLTEAAQSLGASWPVIMFRVIFPNLRVAILSGVFLTFAIVMGEFTFASLLSKPAFGPYMEQIGAMVPYTPQALTVVSFLITWACIAAIQRIARGVPGQGQIGGVR